MPLIPEPLLSVVATSRNDNHGENLLRRTQIFVSGFIDQCKQHGLAGELILVDWNPPTDRPKLAEVLSWPAETSPCQVRLIQVPPELHSRLRHSAELPLFQMIAKNVGIRRARGRFVVATNIDILFSDELIRFIAAGKLEPGRMYRIDRHDVMPDVPLDASMEDRLEYCRTHLVRINTVDGSFDVAPDGRRTLAPIDIAAMDDGITLGAGWQSVECNEEGAPFRWSRSGAEFLVEPRPGPARALRVEIEPGPGVKGRSFDLQVKDHRGQVVAEGTVGECRQLLYITLPAGTDQPCEYGLHVARDSRAQSRQIHPLDFRLFRLAWADRTADAAVGSPRQSFTAIDMHMDIMPPGAGIELGRGWYRCELYEGETFRWVHNDAELDLQTLDGRPHSLSLEVVPGPGLDGKPFELRLCDESDRVVDRAMVLRRQWITLSAPHKPGQVSTFRLRIDSDDARISGDPRILNFRVFHLVWSDFNSSAGAFGQLPATALGETANHLDAPSLGRNGLAFGRGWLKSEHGEESHARLGTHGAELFAKSLNGHDRHLRLELKLEPTAAGHDLELEVRNDADLVVTRTRLADRGTVLLPVRPNRIERFHLCLPEGADRETRQSSRNFSEHKYGDGPRARGEQSPALFSLLRWNWAEVRDTAISDETVEHKQEPRRADIADSTDIIAPDSEIAFGDGWSEPEQSGALVCRWVGPWADVFAGMPRDLTQMFCLDVEPAPEFSKTPLTLWVCDYLGRRIETFRVDGRMRIEIKTPDAIFDGSIAFRLFVKNCDVPASGTSEIRVLRVYRCAWSDPSSTTDATLSQEQSDSPSSSVEVMSPGKQKITCPERLHTNACGDFTLMTREDWFDLRGYPELEVFSFHLDSVLCFAAHHAGIRECILPEPMRIYHIEHGAGSGWTPEGQAKLWKRIIAKGIPFLENEDLWTWALAMRRLQAPMIFNREDWGMVSEQLPETVIAIPG